MLSTKTLRALLTTTLMLVSGLASAGVVSVSHLWDGSELSGAERLNRNGIASVAGSQKSFPGVLGNNPTYFTVWQFDVAVGSVFSLTSTGSLLDGFFSAYDGAFNPANLAAHYLGDAGSSGQAAFSIDAPASGHVWLVGSSLNGNSALGLTLSADVNFTPADTNSVPEPSALALVGVAGFGMLAITKRRRRST